MKKLIWIMTITMFPLFALAQADKPVRHDNKMERKLAKQEAFAAQKAILQQLADNRNLVLEATAIYGRHGFNATVVQNNFILIDSNNFVLQTSSPNNVGYNGMGGVTIRGVITSYEVEPGTDKNPIIIRAQVNTFGLGAGTLIMRLNDSSNSQATFTTNMGGNITFSGPVTSIEESSVYKGMNLY